MATSVVDVGRHALMTVLVMVSPVLGVALLVGVVVGILQTITQVQDASLSQVPRMLAIIVTVAVCLPWLISKMVTYAETLFGNVPLLLGGG